MANQNDLSRSVVAFEQRNTIIAVIEMSSEQLACCWDCARN